MLSFNNTKLQICTIKYNLYFVIWEKYEYFFTPPYLLHAYHARIDPKLIGSTRSFMN